MPLEPASPGYERHRADLLVSIFVGGCLGGLARYAAVRAWPTPGGAFPWSTLVVNLAGSFLLALVLVTARRRGGRHLRPVLGTGFCGAFTTFSSAVVDTDRLLGHGHALMATAYLGATIVGSLAAVGLGLLVEHASTVVFPGDPDQYDPDQYDRDQYDPDQNDGANAC